MQDPSLDSRMYTLPEVLKLSCPASKHLEEKYSLPKGLFPSLAEVTVGGMWQEWFSTPVQWKGGQAGVLLHTGWTLDVAGGGRGGYSHWVCV